MRYDPSDRQADRRRDDHRDRHRRTCPGSTSTSPDLTVARSTVDGAAGAGTERDGDELVVTPAAGIASGAPFTVGDRLRRRARADRSRAGARRDRLPAHRATARSRSASPSRPRTWFPVNDHPRDKATYTIEITVPGRARPRSATASWRARRPPAAGPPGRWAESQPMASYLATVVIGKYRVTHGHPRRQAGRDRGRQSLPAGRSDRRRWPAPPRSPTSWRPSSGRTRSTRTAAS